MKLLKSKLFLFIMAIVIISCVLMAVSYLTEGPSVFSNLLGAIVTPIEKGVSAISDGVSSFFGYFYRFSSLEEENGRLTSELAEYQKLEVQYNAAIMENIQLRKLTGLLEKHSDFVCEPASVISLKPSGFQSNFTIDRGSASGVENGDCVVTEKGLVGYITSVGLNYSEVCTIVNLDFKAGAFVSRTREVVVAEGDFELASNNYLRLSYLKNDTDIKAGDLIETSGSGLFPKGLVIGRVVRVELERHGISSFAVVRPAVDLTELTSVFVVKDYAIVE